jgi:transglutaminase-like putative cysteine protease
MSVQSTQRGEQLALVIFTCAAVAAFGSAFNQPAAWVFWLPAIISPFWQFKRLPRGLDKWAPYATWPLLASTVTLGVVLMAYAPLFSGRTTKWLTLISGYGLGLLASVYLLGTPLWNSAETVIPAATGLAVVACFNPLAVIAPLLATPGAAAFAYLLLSKRVRLGQILSTRLALSTLASALLAGALYFSLPRVQRQIDAVTVRWLSGETGGANPFGIHSQLGDLQRLQLSRRVVLRVWTPRPQKLRARVFGRFDGHAWQARVTAGRALRPAPEGSGGVWLEDVPGNSFLFPRAEAGLPAAATPTRIVQSVANPGALATPGNKLLVRVPLPNLRADRFDNLVPSLTSEVPIYGVVNLAGAQDAEGVIPDPREDFLELPFGLDPRWPALAMQLAANTPSTEDRVARTIEYVKHAAKYSLDVGEFRSGQPITEFLFEKKRGYCQYFATAAALLLRLEGIPARYVTGYNVQEFNQLGGYFIVRDADAHAWVDVLVKGKGWVEADPTPEAEFEARRGADSSGRLAEYGEWFAALTAETWVLLSQGDWRDAVVRLWHALKTAFQAGLFLIVFLLGLAAALRWVRGRRRRSGQPLPHRLPAESPEGEAQLQELRETLERSWEKVGFPRPSSRGLLEHLEGILPDKVSAEFMDLSRRFTNAYYRLRFGARKLSSDDLRELGRLSAQLAAEAQRTLNAGRS